MDSSINGKYRDAWNNQKQSFLLNLNWDIYSFYNSTHQKQMIIWSGCKDVSGCFASTSLSLWEERNSLCLLGKQGLEENRVFFHECQKSELVLKATVAQLPAQQRPAGHGHWTKALGGGRLSWWTLDSADDWWSGNNNEWSLKFISQIIRLVDAYVNVSRWCQVFRLINVFWLWLWMVRHRDYWLWHVSLHSFQ